MAGGGDGHYGYALGGGKAQWGGALGAGCEAACGVGYGHGEFGVSGGCYGDFAACGFDGYGSGFDGGGGDGAYASGGLNVEGAYGDNLVDYRAVGVVPLYADVFDAGVGGGGEFGADGVEGAEVMPLAGGEDAYFRGVGIGGEFGVVVYVYFLDVEVLGECVGE